MSAQKPEVPIVAFDNENAEFGEGLAVTDGGRIWHQLLWHTTRVRTFERRGDKLVQAVGEWKSPMLDGWGLTFDGKNLIGSDSSSTLYWIDPETKGLADGAASVFVDNLPGISIQDHERRYSSHLEAFGNGGLPVPVSEWQRQPVGLLLKVRIEVLLAPVAADEDDLERLAVFQQGLVDLPQLRREHLARRAPVRAEVQPHGLALELLLGAHLSRLLPRHHWTKQTRHCSHDHFRLNQSVLSNYRTIDWLVDLIKVG